MNELFPVEAVAMDSPRLVWMKRYQIKTHHAPHMTEAPWIAIQPYSNHAKMDVAAIMAEACRIYDEAGRTGYGMTEDEAMTELAVSRKIKLWNEETTV